MVKRGGERSGRGVSAGRVRGQGFSREAPGLEFEQSSATQAASSCTSSEVGKSSGWIKGGTGAGSILENLDVPDRPPQALPGLLLF